MIVSYNRVRMSTVIAIMGRGRRVDTFHAGLRGFVSRKIVHARIELRYPCLLFFAGSSAKGTLYSNRCTEKK